MREPVTTMRSDAPSSSSWAKLAGAAVQAAARAIAAALVLPSNARRTVDLLNDT